MANKLEGKPRGKNLALVRNTSGPCIITSEGRVFTTFRVKELSDAEAKKAHNSFLQRFGDDSVCNDDDSDNVDVEVE